MKIYYVICLVLFLSLQHSLLLSNNSIFNYYGLKNTLNAYNSEANTLIAKNKNLQLEISKFKKNRNYLEVYARENFGYIKKNEVFYQIVKDEK
tara:strand:- start:342 stop:620 length:279 start_codon:yes stop_codon:yes gene_type:complete